MEEGLLTQSFVVKENNRLFLDWGGWRQKPRQEPIVDEDKEISMGQSMRFWGAHYVNQCRSLLVQLTQTVIYPKF